VFDIHHTGHGNAISVGGYPILARAAEMKEMLKSQ
jgi:enoyl-CoA hydratase